MSDLAATRAFCEAQGELGRAYLAALDSILDRWEEERPQKPISARVLEMREVTRLRLEAFAWLGAA